MDIESDEEQGGGGGGGGDRRFSSSRSNKRGGGGSRGGGRGGEDEEEEDAQFGGSTRSRPSSRPSSNRSGRATAPQVHDPVGNGHFEDEREADDLLEDECCYNVFVSMRGRTPGRRLKRTIFKFNFAQLICGFSIFTIACYENSSIPSSHFITDPQYGSSLLSLQFATGILTVFMGIASFFTLKYWASLVTNRDLLAKLMYLNIIFCMIVFAITLWCTCVLFLIVKGIDWKEERDKSPTTSFYLSFIFNTIVICPYLAATPFYIMDVSVILDDIELGGEIAEPNVRRDQIIDLSGVSTKDFFTMICAFPLLLLTQLLILLEALFALLHYCSTCGRPAGRGTGGMNRTSLFSSQFWRLARTPGPKKTRAATVSPDEEEDVAPSKSNLVKFRPVDSKGEGEEEDEGDDVEEARRADEKRLAMEKKAAEEMRLNELEQQRLRDAEAAEARSAKTKEQEEERRIREAAAAESLEANQAAEDDDEEKNEDAKPSKLTMNASQFKTLWATLEPAGSFQCRLKMMPTIATFVEHMKRQGFHIVFATSPATGGIEVGICNIRTGEEDSWFLARFLATSANFSAVMKCQDLSAVEKYVRKFALAKVLKIDT